MNICFLSDAKAEHTRRWTTFFGARGHNVHLVTWNPDVLPGYEPVEVHVFNKHPGLAGALANIKSFRSSLRRLIREKNIEVLHAHTCCAYAWTAFAAGFHPYVVTPWGTDLFEIAANSMVKGALTDMALRGADLVTCDAEHMREKLENLGVRNQRIRIVMFGVNMRRFSPNPEAAMEMRRRWGLEDATVILSTRTHWPIHDVFSFVKAIPPIAAACPDARFVVAADGGERKAFEEFVAASGLAGRVIFPGYLTEDEMAGWLRAADIYVSTSLADAGLASSTAEAMAIGLPAVITEFGDNGLWVEEGKGGLLVPVKAPEKVADAVIHLVRSPEMRSRFGQYNRQQIDERYNYDREMEKMEGMYLDLIERRRGVRPHPSHSLAS